MSYAIIFSGQGGNTKFLKQILLNKKNIKYLFDETSEYINFNIWKAINNNKINTFNKKKKIIQPILFTISVAIYKIWMQYKPIPIISAGNSLGEYAALTCANSIKFSDVIKLLILRQKYMKESIKEDDSFMTIIQGLNKNIIKKICKYIQKKKNIYISNFNTSKKIVITGKKKEILKTIKYFKYAGKIFIYNLPIYTIAHCILLKKASKKLNFALKKIKFKKPDYSIINNVYVKYKKNIINIKKALIKQLYKPVRWEETINYIISKKINYIIEIGSTGINKYFLKKKSIQLLSIKNLYNLIKKKY